MTPAAPGTVLVAGVSGVVGYAAAQAFARAGWSVVGVARRPPAGLAGLERVTTVACDLTDARATAALAEAHPDVTHVVYAALFELPGLVTGWLDAEQMAVNDAMFRNLMDPLVAHATGLRHVSLLQGTKAYGAHVEVLAVPGRERSPRHDHPNFYWLQEDHLRGLQARAGGRFTHTILRPQIIFGESLGSNMNPIPALGTYAAVLRAQGEPLHYPGGAAGVMEAVDADLLADVLVWAAGDGSAAAADQTFNVTNGDVFTLRNVWPVLADVFGMERGEDRPMSLAAQMPPLEPVWADVVGRFGLAAPTSLEAFVGQSYVYADVIGGAGFASPPPPVLVSTIKLRQAGFGACVDTEDMFAKWIERMRTRNLLPPRAGW
jgi:nucleoside-diphosphate-sugar epimerase